MPAKLKVKPAPKPTDRAFRSPLPHDLPAGFIPPVFTRCEKCECVTVRPEDATPDAEPVPAWKTPPRKVVTEIDHFGMTVSLATGQMISFMHGDGSGGCLAYYLQPDGYDHAWIAVRVSNEALYGPVTHWSPELETCLASD